jgi:hypothetical protein
MDMKASQQCDIAIVAEDKFGNPTGAFDAAPVWSLADQTLGSVQVSEDGLKATLVPSGKLGQTQLSVVGQADGKALQGVLDVNIIAGDATQIVLQPAAPVDQP